MEIDAPCKELKALETNCCLHVYQRVSERGGGWERSRVPVCVRVSTCVLYVNLNDPPRNPARS